MEDEFYMLIASLEDNNGCWLWHKWETVKESSGGFTLYQKCKKCAAKRILQEGSGYQPVNWDWVRNLRSDD